MSTKKKRVRRAAAPKVIEHPDDGVEYIEGLSKVVRQHNVNMNEVCRRSSVSRSVWTRWQNEPPATLKKLSRLKRNTEALIQERKDKTKAAGAG